MTTASPPPDATGVDYGTLDMFKRACQEAAALTDEHSNRHGIVTLPWTRGESVMLFQIFNPGVTKIGLVHEGLGTKNLVADAMGTLTGDWSYYRAIGQDTLAMAFNDAATLGVIPAVVTMHLSVGHADWFKNEARYKSLIRGWVEGCADALCVWGPGETPGLKDILLPNAAELSAAVFGKTVGDFAPDQIRPGMAIVAIQGTGIHANGLTFARELAEKLEGGYLTEITPGGPTFGHALLQPTPLYSRAVEMLEVSGVSVAYAVNVTGHGLRKLVRPRTNEPLAFVIDELPEQLPIFRFMQDRGDVDDRRAYASWNMNFGYCLFVEQGVAARACEIVAREFGHRAFVAGHIEAAPQGAKVVIDPLGLTYEADELQIR